MTKPGSSHRVIFLLGALSLFLLGLGWRSITRRAYVAESIPLQPALAGWPAELSQRLVEAEETARGYSRPIAGLITLSRLYHANGLYPEAMQCYQALQQLEPGRARWWHLQASILAAFGEIEAALPLWRRAIELDPDYIPARVRLGDILIKANRTTEAAKAYTEIVANNPDNPYAWLGLARGAIIGGDWSGARDRLQRAIKANPDFIGALSLMVTVHEHDNEAREARELRALIGRREFSDIADPWLDELSEDCYDSYRLSVAAAVARGAGNPQAARRNLERAIALAPTVGSYHRQLGQLLFHERENLQARRQLELALAMSPDDPDAWLLLVDIMTELGEAAQGERVLAAGLAACPQSAALHYAYGHRLSVDRRYGEALAELQLSKKLRPSEANAYIDLAMVYFGMERIEEGVAELKQAIAVQPGHVLALQVLARHAIDTGDESAARRWIRQLRAQARGSEDDVNLILSTYRQRFGRAAW